MEAKAVVTNGLLTPLKIEGDIEFRNVFFN